MARSRYAYGTWFQPFFWAHVFRKSQLFRRVGAQSFFFNENRVEVHDEFHLTDDLTDYALEFLKESVLQSGMEAL